MRSTLVAWCALSALWTVPGLAQEGTPAASAAPTADGATPATAPSVPVEADSSAAADTGAVDDAVAPGPDSAEETYHLAFAALADGDAALARSLLKGLLADHPDHPLAERAQELIAVLDAPTHTRPAAIRGPRAGAPASDDERAIAPTPRGERRTGLARAELVFAQTVHGIALGAEVCVIAECEEAQPWSAMLMLGAGAGFGISFFASDGGVTPGLSRALTDGVLWGATNGLLLMLGTEATKGVGDEGPVVAGHMAAGQLLGLAAAAGLHYQLEPTAGQVSLTSSGGLWTLAATAQLMGAIDPDIDEDGWAWLLLGASDVGLLAGGLLAAHQPMGTSRVLMIDAGGLLGALVGIGAAVIAQGDPERGPTLGSGFVGTLAGLGIAYHLTRNWDRDQGDSGARITLMPTPGGAAIGLHGWL